MAKLIAGGGNPPMYSKREGLKLFNKTRYSPWRAEHVIKKDKQLAVFIPIASREKDGGWIRIREGTTCINIPDENSKNFTQYAVGRALRGTKQDKNAKYALFVRRTRNAKYEFYGVFSRIQSGEDDYSTYFKWESDELELNEWQKE